MTDAHTNSSAPGLAGNTALGIIDYGARSSTSNGSIAASGQSDGLTQASGTNSEQAEATNAQGTVLDNGLANISVSDSDHDGHAISSSSTAIIFEDISTETWDSVPWDPATGYNQADGSDAHPHLIEFNPWKDIIGFVPSRHYKVGPNNFRLMSTDVLQCMLPFLDNVSLLALSQACPDLRKQINPIDPSSLNPAEKWSFILLLERDSPDKIACQKCKLLHPPQPLHGATIRSYIHKPPHRHCEFDHTPMTMFGIHMELALTSVRLVAKHHLRQQQLQLKRVLNQGFTTWRHILPSIRIFTQSALHLIDGSLVGMYQTYIHPFNSKGQFTGRAAWLLERALQYELPHPDYKLSRGDDFLRKCPWTRCGSSTDEWHPMRAEFHRKEGHFSNCYDLDAIFTRDMVQVHAKPPVFCAMFHDQPCTLMGCIFDTQKQVSRLGTVVKHPMVPTLHAVNGVDVPGVGKCVVITRWDDYGGVQTGEWRKWEARAFFAQYFCTTPGDVDDGVMERRNAPRYLRRLGYENGDEMYERVVEVARMGRPSGQVMEGRYYPIPTEAVRRGLSGPSNCPAVEGLEIGRWNDDAGYLMNGGVWRGFDGSD